MRGPQESNAETAVGRSGLLPTCFSRQALGGLVQSYSQSSLRTSFQPPFLSNLFSCSDTLYEQQGFGDMTEVCT